MTIRWFTGETAKLLLFLKAPAPLKLFVLVKKIRVLIDIDKLKLVGIILKSFTLILTS